MIFYITLFTLVGSLFSLVGGVVLLRQKQYSERVILSLTGFAAGVLLTTAFLDLFPEALEQASDLKMTLTAALAGMVTLFIFERYFFWHHHHHESHGNAHPSVFMVVLGDSIHNLIDGIAIAGAFIISIPLGIVTSLAVAAHEIPQEIADFSVLLSRGVGRKNTLLLNIASSLTALIGAYVTLLLSDSIKPYLPLVIAFTAGMFIYIASSDLIPELHKSSQRKGNAFAQTAMFLVGIGAVVAIQSLLHDFIPH